MSSLNQYESNRPAWEMTSTQYLFEARSYYKQHRDFLPAVRKMVERLYGEEIEVGKPSLLEALRTAYAHHEILVEGALEEGNNIPIQVLKEYDLVDEYYNRNTHLLNGMTMVFPKRLMPKQKKFEARKIFTDGIVAADFGDDFGMLEVIKYLQSLYPKYRLRHLNNSIVLFLKDQKVLGYIHHYQEDEEEELFDTRLILSIALNTRCTGIIISRNQVTHDPEPTEEDEAIVDHFQSACKLLNIVFLDHVIVTHTDFFSFYDQGMLHPDIDEDENDEDALNGIAMKTPISYYGGKQMMAQHIVPIIPEHRIYVEPFFGGGAIFFAKEPSEVEMINDLNDGVINFYRVAKNDFPKLKKEIDATLHSRSTRREAVKIFYGQEKSTDVKKAWAFWVLSKMSFANNPVKSDSFAFDKKGASAKLVANAKKKLDESIESRLEGVQIESHDALKVIKQMDCEDAFFYVDPPYVSSNCGAYKGYTMEDFKNLLDVLANIKGKFLLSSYPEDILMKYRKKYGWKSQDIVKKVAVTGKRKGEKLKTECLTMNYIPT